MTTWASKTTSWWKVIGRKKGGKRNMRLGALIAANETDALTKARQAFKGYTIVRVE